LAKKELDFNNAVEITQGMKAIIRDSQLLKRSSGTSAINQVRGKVTMAKARLMQTVNLVIAVARQIMCQVNVGSRTPPATSVRKRVHIATVCQSKKQTASDRKSSSRHKDNTYNWMNLLVLQDSDDDLVIFHFQ